MPNPLAINTARGQQSLDHERRAAAWIEGWSGVRMIETPRAANAKLDSLMVRGSQVVAVSETKVRYDIADADALRVKYRNEWLVTWSKLASGMEVAAALGVPFFGVLVLAQSGDLLLQQIARVDDGTPLLCCRITLDTTMTQKTINGGSVERVNAYIDMSRARVFRGALSPVTEV